MALINYVEGVPAANNNPSDDQSDMLINTNSNFAIWNVDHSGFITTNSGYHTVVHSIDNVTDPTPVAGTGEYYAKTVGSDVEAFYQSANGVITQLTGATAPAPTPNGYVYLPGGLLMQWGFVSSFGSSGTTNFNIAYPNAVFSIVLTSSTTANTNHANGMYVRGTSGLASFNWNQADLASTQNGFYWMALGN